MLNAQAQGAVFKAELSLELRVSDFLHWGAGEVNLTDSKFVHEPRRVAEVKTFDGFNLELAEDIDLTRYNAVVIWCEAFGEFISAARFRD